MIYIYIWDQISGIFIYVRLLFTIYFNIIIIINDEIYQYIKTYFNRFIRALCVCVCVCVLFNLW